MGYAKAMICKQCHKSKPYRRRDFICDDCRRNAQADAEASTELVDVVVEAGALALEAVIDAIPDAPDFSGGGGNFGGGGADGDW